MSITITMPGTPVAKARPRMTKRGHVYTPTKTSDYESALRAKAHLEMRDRPRFTGPVAVVMLAQVRIPAYWSKKKREAALRGEIAPGKPDVDNYAKIVGDALNGVVFTDDSQIVHLTASKKYGDPLLVVTVRAA